MRPALGPPTPGGRAVASSMPFDEQAACRIEAGDGTPDVAATRAAVLAALEPRTGERIVDLGCGPGYMARELALAIGTGGRVHALDLSGPMLALARRRCRGLPAVGLTAGDVTALPLPDGGVDAAVALQSLAYVPDVARAIGEIARVLRPGGRAVVLDTDFASVVWHGRDQARVDRILAAYDVHVAHPGLPRRLGRLAADAGTAPVRPQVVPILTASFQPDPFAHGIALFIRNFVV